jgi:DNA-binding LacI/PurR family transcriptional regulator
MVKKQPHQRTIVNPSLAVGFRKKSLAEQVADNLRDGIRSGAWKNYLPPTRSLSKILGASRPVVGQAIHRLRMEGLLEISRRAPVRIRPVADGKRPVSRKRVALLLAAPLYLCGQALLTTIDEMRKVLYGWGYQLEIVEELRIRRRQPSEILRKLVQQYTADCWILPSVPIPVQKWFEKQGVRVVVSGHTFPTVKLPSVDIDLKAVTRHAGGIFLGLGHRRIVYLLKRTDAAGELVMEEGFHEAIRIRPDAACQVVWHSGELSEIRSALKALFRRSPPPTAVLVSHAMDVPVVLTWMLEQGIRIPRDLSLISQQSEGFLDRLTPTPSQYQMDQIQHARDVCRLIETPSYKRGCIRAFPRFNRGETLGPTPKSV